MAKETEKYKQSQKKTPKSVVSGQSAAKQFGIKDSFREWDLESMEGISAIIEPAAVAHMVSAGSQELSGLVTYTQIGYKDHERANTLVILNTQYCTCLIIEVTDTKVIAETLIDKENNFTQTRSFDKSPFEGVIDCKEGAIFNLTIVTKPGSREFIYTPGNPDDIKYFEETLVDTTSLQNDLKNDPVYNQGPILNDDGDSF